MSICRSISGNRQLPNPQKESRLRVQKTLKKPNRHHANSRNALFWLDQSFEIFDTLDGPKTFQVIRLKVCQPGGIGALSKTNAAQGEACHVEGLGLAKDGGRVRGFFLCVRFLQILPWCVDKLTI